MGFQLTPRAAHPGRALFPKLAGALSPALQREGVRLAGGGKDRGCRAAGGPEPPPLPPAPGLRTEGRAWAQGRWETQRLYRARSPRHNRRARQILTPWGGAQPPCKRRPQLACHSPTACQPSSCRALPPTWAWPCPGPTGGASHPVSLCAVPGGPGQSAPAPASTGHSPSPPPGGPLVSGGELGLGPGLDSGAPGHPAGRRH